LRLFWLDSLGVWGLMIMTEVENFEKFRPKLIVERVCLKCGYVFCGYFERVNGRAYLNRINVHAPGSRCPFCGGVICSRVVLRRRC